MPRISPFRRGTARLHERPAGSAEAFERVVAPQVESLYRLAYRLTGHRHDAEDLVQELLVRLYPRCAELANLDEPRSWLARSLYNLFVDGLRSRQRSPVGLADFGSEELLGSMADAGATPEAQTDRHLLQRRLVEALATLNEDQRLVVALHDMEGYTLTELEHVLDTPLGTLKSRLHRARESLKRQLREEPFAPAQRVNA